MTQSHQLLTSSQSKFTSTLIESNCFNQPIVGGVGWAEKNFLSLSEVERKNFKRKRKQCHVQNVRSNFDFILWFLNRKNTCDTNVTYWLNKENTECVFTYPYLYSLIYQHKQSHAHTSGHSRINCHLSHVQIRTYIPECCRYINTKKDSCSIINQSLLWHALQSLHLESFEAFRVLKTMPCTK